MHNFADSDHCQEEQQMEDTQYLSLGLFLSFLVVIHYASDDRYLGNCNADKSKILVTLLAFDKLHRAPIACFELKQVCRYYSTESQEYSEAKYTETEKPMWILEYPETRNLYHSHN